MHRLDDNMFIDATLRKLYNYRFIISELEVSDQLEVLRPVVFMKIFNGIPKKIEN